MSAAVAVAMPRLSDSMESGTLVRWLKAPGERVARGEELVEIETDKATMVYESDAEGHLAIDVAEGETVALGATIARLFATREQALSAGEGPAAETAAPTVPAAVAAAPGPPASAAPARADGSRADASPLARRIAADLGVALAGLSGSGPRGRIVKADVLAAANGAAPPAAPPAAPASAPEVAPAGGAKGAVESRPLSRLQQVVARRMAEAKATAPDFALTVEVDMSEAVRLRAQLKQLGTPAPSFNDMVVKAAALALRAHPLANGSYRDGAVERYERVNVGVAVASEGALVVPTVFDADAKSLGAIAAATRAAAERVRAGTITPPELAGATFTVSNLGMFGIARFTAVLNPPQAAILAVGAIAQRPAVVDGALAVRDELSLTLTCDHRILYGADAARFLSTIKATLERPASLLL